MRSKSQIIAHVRHLLDEQDLMGHAELTDLVDTMPVDERISTLYGSAWDESMRLLPVELLPLEPMAGVLMPDLQCGAGRYRLPGDFVRLGWFKMKGWRRGVSRVVNEGSAEHALQMSGATRGGCVNPVVVLTDGGRYLDYYSLRRGLSKHEVERAEYVGHSKGIGKDDCDERAMDAVELILARDVAASMGRDINVFNKLIKEKYGKGE